MKTIDNKKLFEMGKRGEIDMAEVKKHILESRAKIFGQPNKDNELDEREPIERISDELCSFIKTIKSVEDKQCDRFDGFLLEISALAKSIEASARKYGENKKDGWEIEVDAERDRDGYVIYPYKIKVARL